MSVNPIAGMSEGGGENPEMEFHTDQESVHYRFPISIGDVRGRVLTPDGAPLLDAQVSLGWESHEGWEEIDRPTDGNGSFRFQSVRLGGDFMVTVWPDDGKWLPGEFQPSHSDMEGEMELVLQPAHVIRMIIKMKLLPERVAYLKVLDYTPNPGTTFDPEDYWWRQARAKKYYLKLGNRPELTMLRQGTYTVALFHSEIGFTMGNGAKPQMREIHRWTLSTDGTPQTLKVDWPH